MACHYYIIKHQRLFKFVTLPRGGSRPDEGIRGYGEQGHNGLCVVSLL